MAKINVESGGTILSSGLLQLSGGAAMSGTLTAVTDQNNTASQLKLATNLTQVAGTLQIALDGGTYIDAQDTSGIDRFNVNRSVGSQQVNVDFSSNPTSGTDAVGALRTYANGSALSEAMTFLRNGNVGINTNSPQDKLDVNGAIRIRSNTPNLTSVSDNAVIDYVSTSIFATAPCIRLSAIGTGSVGADVRFYTGTNSSLSEKMRITSTGTVGINVTTPTAQLQVKGSGSTSATTSLLVQNSSSSQLLKVTDDGQMTVISSNPYADILLSNGSAANTGIKSSGYTVYLNSNASNVASWSYVTYLNASKLAVGGTVGSMTPHSSSVLDCQSTVGGFLPPRMTNAQRLAIATPAVGLVVYCTDAVEGLYVYKSTGWTFVI